MPPGISRGSREHCLAALRTDEFDLHEFPLKTYGELDRFSVGGVDVRIYQGVNTVPQERFQVSLDEPAARHAGLDVPGVVPFLVSAFQVSAKKRRGSPRPTHVGLPLLTTESDYLIRWMFGRNGATHAQQTLWRRLGDAELDSLPGHVRPNPSIKPQARSGSSYQAVSGAYAAPEPSEFVDPRAGGLPHEPWLARSVELAEGWRVVVPNTSISCRPAVVPPDLTIVGQNFNVLVCPSPEVALAIAAILSRPQPLAYLTGIAPWSQGDTPRPRSKHVKTTLWTFAEHVHTLLIDTAPELARFAGHLRHVWQLQLRAALSIARAEHAPGQPLRNRYTAIEPRDQLDAVPIALEGLRGQHLRVGTGRNTVQIEFRTQEGAALGAVAVWCAQPRALSIGQILSLRFSGDLAVSPPAVSEVLFDERWRTFVGDVDEAGSVGP